MRERSGINLCSAQHCEHERMVFPADRRWLELSGLCAAWRATLPSIVRHWRRPACRTASLQDGYAGASTLTV